MRLAEVKAAAYVVSPAKATPIGYAPFLAGALVWTEHCETTLGYAVCGHYAGEPAADAIDGFRRLYGIWLANAKPDCSQLRCLA